MGHFKFSVQIFSDIEEGNIMLMVLFRHHHQDSSMFLYLPHFFGLKIASFLCFDGRFMNSNVSVNHNCSPLLELKS